MNVSTIAVVFIKELRTDRARRDGRRHRRQHRASSPCTPRPRRARASSRTEPVDATYRQLSGDVRVDSLQDRITAYNLGVTGTRERRAITISAEGSPFSSLFGDGRGTQEIECVGLEDVFEENGIEHCDVLKLDCEGAEFEILDAPEHILEPSAGGCASSTTTSRVGTI